MPTEFTPVAALVGGALIGLSAVIMMLSAGRIAGVSGIVARLLPPGDQDGTGQRALWPIAFVAGLIIAPLLHLLARGGQPLDITLVQHPLLLVLGGLAVGFGTVLGSGCTSGHGVCGISRFSVRSLVATVVFVAVAVITTTVVRHGFGVMQ